jgi:hypothetical protein
MTTHDPPARSARSPVDPLERATRLLRDAVRDVGDVEALPPRRDEAIAALAGAIRERASARRRSRIFGSLAIAAGVVAIAGGGVMAFRRGSSEVAKTDLGVLRDTSGVTVVREGHLQPLGTNERIAEGAELRTSSGSEARLEFDSGTQVTASGNARVKLVEQTKKKRFALEAGSIFARVAKLAPEDRFVVATPDAEIEVRGTAFRVSLVTPDRACGDGTPTRLDVAEGVVVVRHAGQETRVAAGESWPKCAKVEAPAPATATAVAAAAPVTPTSSAAARAPRAASHLGEQNDLFDQAMREKREGRTAASIATLEHLLATYPQGPLAENAAVERMRMLAGSNPARGAQAARDYLRRWPHGYARAEAESLAGSP